MVCRPSLRLYSCGLALLSWSLACRPSAPSAAPEPAAAHSSSSTAATSEPAAPAAAGSGEAGWRQLADVEGIVVSEHPSAHSDTPIFRGVGVVEAPLLEILAVVTDADRHHEWVFSCSASRMIEQTSRTTGLVYNRTATPWPVPDRDVVLTSQIELIDAEQEILVRFSAVEHPGTPPQDGVIRMPYLEGHYHLRAEGPRRTVVEYQVDSDPGGRLPAWLARQGTRDMPLETLRALRTQLVATRGAYAERVAELRASLLSR